jgi:tRNA (cmo5U34)-methyltransferase
MDTVRLHFEEEAREFDRVIVTLIPEYGQMVEALVTAIPFDRSATIRVADLGCGTGTVTGSVLRVFPNAQVTCLDLAENMVAIARAKLSRHENIRYRVGDFNTFEFDREYDVVVSSLALHHLITDQDKSGLYRRIYQCLAVGGVFYNADVVLGSSDALQAVYMDQWRAFMRGNISEKEVNGTWLPKYYAEDRPAKLMDQLAWMKDIGFSDIDVVWKRFNFAVYGGVRQ